MRQLLFCAAWTAACAIQAIKTGPLRACVTMLHPSTAGILRIKHFSGIFVADPLDDVFKDAFIIRKPAAFDLGAQEIAEDPLEVFVPCVGQEAS